MISPFIHIPDPVHERRPRLWDKGQNGAAPNERRQKEAGGSLGHSMPDGVVSSSHQLAHFLLKLRGEILLRQLRNQASILLTGRIQYDPAGQVVQCPVCHGDPSLTSLIPKGPHGKAPLP